MSIYPLFFSSDLPLYPVRDVQDDELATVSISPCDNAGCNGQGAHKPIITVNESELQECLLAQSDLIVNYMSLLDGKRYHASYEEFARDGGKDATKFHPILVTITGEYPTYIAYVCTSTSSVRFVGEKATMKDYAMHNLQKKIYSVLMVKIKGYGKTVGPMGLDEPRLNVTDNVHHLAAHRAATDGNIPPPPRAPSPSPPPPPPPPPPSPSSRPKRNPARCEPTKPSRPHEGVEVGTAKVVVLNSTPVKAQQVLIPAAPTFKPHQPNIPPPHQVNIPPPYQPNTPYPYQLNIPHPYQLNIPHPYQPKTPPPRPMFRATVHKGTPPPQPLIHIPENDPFWSDKSGRNPNYRPSHPQYRRGYGAPPQPQNPNQGYGVPWGSRRPR